MSESTSESRGALYNTILIDKKDRVTTLTLNRPEKRNAMSPELHAEMVQALTELAHDDETAVLVITGAGESFCAGQDLKKYFHEIRDTPAAREAARKNSHDWRYRILNHFPKPTIAAVNGYCFGGAFTVVASCDIAIAADEATFGLSEINFGHIPGGMVAKIVADAMIPRQALFYILTGRKFDGKTSRDIGFTTMSVPRANLMDTVYEIAEELKAKDPLALRACKEAFKQVDLRRISHEEALSWLTAKSDQLIRKQSQRGGTDGIESFLKKEYRPGFGPAPQVNA
ncbi:p-hydroxycinnamoyl CoA hydratase/lyase [Micromonospora sicca]|uniref:p-hydroxycinnamoyl CoA hydratase/lyase n=1 Tax=Micromonospora sicca TaxID=2202420 RepID=UPI002ACC2B99|nr:p-hydroxycinnamoyl CoA hydratase/lyase [Micromonospora sp. 4G53]